MRQTYSATPESVGLARRAVSAFARKIGGKPEDVRAIALAVSEACSNVAVYAYRGHAAPGEMVVHAEEADGHLKVRVIDHGVGLVPRLDRPGIGLGLPMMAQLCDKFELTTSEGGGTEVRMQFELSVKQSGFSELV